MTESKELRFPLRWNVEDFSGSMRGQGKRVNGMVTGGMAADDGELRRRLQDAQIELCRQYAMTQQAFDRAAVDDAQSFWAASTREPLPPFVTKGES